MVSNTMMYLIWAIAIIAFGVLEGITFQLVSIWFVFGAIAALIAAFCGAEFYLQVIICIVVSLVALLVTRPIAKRKLNTKIQPTNADRCIGSEAVVVQLIDNLAGTGEVRIDGKVWTARSADGSVIDNGKIVVVEKIEGVKLIVKSI